jgi:hypothetical protein
MDLIEYEQKRNKLNKVLLEANDIYNYYSGNYSNKKTTNMYDYINNIIYSSKYPILAAGNECRINYARTLKDKFNIKRRVTTTLSRFIRRGLGYKQELISDYDLQLFQIAANLAIKPEENFESQIKVLKGTALREFYRDTNIVSCMTGESKNHLIEFYEKNPDKVSIIVINNLARALLWTLPSGDKFLDNTYGYFVGRDIIKKWADKNYSLINKNINCYNILRNTIIEMNLTTFGPYIDVFKYGFLSEKSNKIYIASNRYILNYRFGDVNVIFSSDINGRIPYEPVF